MFSKVWHMAGKTYFLQGKIHERKKECCLILSMLDVFKNRKKMLGNTKSIQHGHSKQKLHYTSFLYVSERINDH